MESLSRPFHRRKLSNANNFSAKHAYDGVFSGHRPKFDGATAVTVEEYHEIFGSAQADSSIPVLDLSTFEHSSDGPNSEIGSTKPDYARIFGGFRDEDIAVSYEELVARDKARAPSSTSQSSPDSDNLRDQSSSDALKQFNMSYNKISQRSKDGLYETTHVTKLQAVPGFTCFIDESASQPKKETKKQKSAANNNNLIPSVESRSKYRPDASVSDDNVSKTFQAEVKSHSSTDETASQLKKESEKKKSSVVNNVQPTVDSSKVKEDFSEKQKAESGVESTSKHRENESVYDDKVSKTFQAEIKPHSSIDETASQPKKENEKKRSSVVNNVHPTVDSSKEDFPDKQKSEIGVESTSKYRQDNTTSTIEAEIKSQPSKDVTASQLKKETEKKKSSVANNVLPSVDSSKDQTSQSGAESISKCREDKPLSDDRIPKAFQADIKSQPSKDPSSSYTASASNVEDQKYDRKRSTAANSARFKSDIPEAFSPCFDEELDVNSAAATSAAALRKAIEKAQESIRIAKESVGRKKEGLRTKSFKDTLKVKPRVVKPEEPKEKENKIEEIFERIDKHEDKIMFSEFTNGEKLFGAKKVVDEINEKISESVKSFEIPTTSSSHESSTDFAEVVTEGVVDRESSEKHENEDLHKDNQLPNGFLELENCKKNVEDSEDTIKDDKSIDSKENENENEAITDNAEELVEELNNLTVYQKGEEDEKKILIEELGLLQNHNNDDNEVHEEEEEEEEKVTRNSEEEASDKFFDVREVEMIENLQTPKEEESENFQEAENYENSSSEYDDAEAIETEYTSEEREFFETISADQTASEDENDDLAHRGVADVAEKDVKSESSSSSSSDTIHGMEIEVKTETETKTSEMNEKEEKKKDENIEKENEKREWERNRLAVDRVIREARERAFAEARERAAAEKVNAQIRQRLMADKTSAHKLKVERAAVERATSEARQRALEKAMSNKKMSDPKIQVKEIPQTSASSSDVHVSNGTTTESALRTKAKLEKHNRIMERAAKALAEKEKRDLLVQKEQAERSRLAENLDADIKRWSNGKEGNLRALLSTLQYILGAESGWQPVSLTEIITANAVKKAYRKATLCVHPDKLQQRGASIQQKYICEKVFDLLKAAWNRFNSEER